MQSLARNGYTAEQVKVALHADPITLDFRYDLLDFKNVYKGPLSNVISCNVANDTTQAIRRTAKFSIVDDGSINFLSDRIMPWVRVEMPDGGYAEFPQGVFLLSTPTRKAQLQGYVTRDIDAFDQNQVLNDDLVLNRYTVTQTTNYIVAVKALLDSAGIALQNLTPTTSTLPVDLDWDPGTPKLKIINDLLGAINYRSLFFDELGYATAIPNVTADKRASEYTYTDDELSVIYPEVTHTADLFSVPNSWVLYTSEADTTPLVSTYTNTNASSPTSTVSRGRTIVKYQQVQAADQPSLDAMVQQMAFDDSQIYDTVNLPTAIMPMHSDTDVFTVNFSTLGISAKFVEQSWSFDFVKDAQMQHVIKRVVSI